MYVYDCWKARNEIIHGKTEKSEHVLKKAELQHKVAALYKKGRANLSLHEKSYFKLPVEQRQKKGVQSLSLWLQIVECIFKHKGAAQQEETDEWLENTAVIKIKPHQTKSKKQSKYI